MMRQRVHSKDSVTAGSVENALADRTGKMKPARLPDTKIVVIKAGNHSLDMLSDQIVVSNKRFPIDARAVAKSGPC